MMNFFYSLFLYSFFFIVEEKKTIWLIWGLRDQQSTKGYPNWKVNNILYLIQSLLFNLSLQKHPLGNSNSAKYLKNFIKV